MLPFHNWFEPLDISLAIAYKIQKIRLWQYSGHIAINIHINDKQYCC